MFSKGITSTLQGQIKKIGGRLGGREYVGTSTSKQEKEKNLAESKPLSQLFFREKSAGLWSILFPKRTFLGVSGSSGRRKVRYPNFTVKMALRQNLQFRSFTGEARQLVKAVNQIFD